MSKVSKYIARSADANGRVNYPSEEHQTWETLYKNQEALVRERACKEYLQGLSLLDLPPDRIPQLGDVNSVMSAATGWQTEAVAALISFDKFFSLLACQRFPVATFIRSQEELDYLKEPDVFHEVFGHCPLLTHKAFAHFTHQYGKLGLNASQEDRVYLARLYWFTVEFGLLKEAKTTKIYGGGILSSPGETMYALGDTASRREFNMLDVLRTPYRIDIMQPIYYVLESMDQLFEIADMDILSEIKKAKKMGLFAPEFPIKETQAS